MAPFAPVPANRGRVRLLAGAPALHAALGLNRRSSRALFLACLVRYPCLHPLLVCMRCIRASDAFSDVTIRPRLCANANTYDHAYHDGVWRDSRLGPGPPFLRWLLL